MEVQPGEVILSNIGQIFTRDKMPTHKSYKSYLI